MDLLVPNKQRIFRPCRCSTSPADIRTIFTNGFNFNTCEINPFYPVLERTKQSQKSDGAESWLQAGRGATSALTLSTAALAS